ncbi:MAG TPA: tetratricopeptide repeat protein, partial [Kofleriaceae bacterium]|nr:tetratricopeptide repeat protein [Kofleriaceae bacterium]
MSTDTTQSAGPAAGQGPAAAATIAERTAAARRMLAAGDAARAIELLEGIADADASGLALVLLGDACFLAGRFDRAEQAWRAALATCPGDAVLGDKIERAAVAALTDVAATDAQSKVFEQLFSRDYLLAGPHPGQPASPGFEIPHDPDLIDRLVAKVEAG